MSRITSVDVVDVRFPTSDALDGSDAMHPDPDYSAAYVVLRTDGRDADDPQRQGHGLTFTIGRGTEVVCKAVDALVPMVVGHRRRRALGRPRSFRPHARGRFAAPLDRPREGGDPPRDRGPRQRGVGPLAKREEQPLWRLLAGLSPEALVDLVDFTYITDMITPAAAVELLRAQAPHRAARIAELEATGYPAYTTSAGWLGYDDDKIRALCRERDRRRVRRDQDEGRRRPRR